jgi:hypothetical protein
LFQVQIPNKNHVKILRTDSIFEFCMNFKWVQTFCETFDKFSKIFS